MEDVLRIIAAAVAVVASIAGVVVTIDQLTLRNRLRKTETWVREAVGSETDEHRKDALEALRLEVTSRIVGSHAVPVRHFWEVIAYPAVTIATTVWAGNIEQSPADETAVWLLPSVGGVLCLIAFRRNIRYYLERRRVVNTYAAGGSRVPSPRMNPWDGATWPEFWVAVGASAAVVSTAVGASFLFDNRPWPGVLLLTLGIGVVSIAWDWVRSTGRTVG